MKSHGKLEHLKEEWGKNHLWETEQCGKRGKRKMWRGGGVPEERGEVTSQHRDLYYINIFPPSPVWEVRCHGFPHMGDSEEARLSTSSAVHPVACFS